MNPKIEKLAKDIEKTKAKIAEQQARLQDLEKFLKTRQMASAQESSPQEQEEVHED